MGIAILLALVFVVAAVGGVAVGWLSRRAPVVVRLVAVTHTAAIAAYCSLVVLWFF
jgi:hypothetical protein